jgi:hypothetical protein
MAENYLEQLRQHEERTRREREDHEAAFNADRAAKQEVALAWEGVFQALQLGDSNPGQIPDLSSFFALARVLKKRGWFGWLPEMAENISKALAIDDISFYRPAQLYFVELLSAAGKPRASLASLRAIYGAFSPSRPRNDQWRQRGALEVQEFFGQRIANAPKVLAEQQEAARVEAAAKHANILRQAAARRPALKKQLFVVHWKQHGLGLADIRDKWNEQFPEDHVGDGTPGRENVKASLRHGIAFLKDHGATITEMASILDISF